MLILIVGATGNIGQNLVRSALARQHRVRILARSPDKLAPELHSQLESAIRISSYYDISALDKACAGVDAVICAYTGQPELQLEGNLLLLRAAERAGVEVFVPTTWNGDWRSQKLGDQESYNAYLSFHQHVIHSSEIRPIYIFTGVLAEVLFAKPGHGDFTVENHGMWDPKAKCFETWGSGNEQFPWTTESDAAEFTLSIVGRPDAAAGGFWNVCSERGSVRDIAAIYEKVRGRKVPIKILGSLDELRKKALAARAEGDPRNFWGYIGYFYQLYQLDGTWVPKQYDTPMLEDVCPTKLDQFLKENPEI